MAAQRLACSLALLAALAAASCGVGAGPAPPNAQLLVTDDFGKQVLVAPRAPKVGGSDTVMRFLQRNAKVSTRYGGGFVQSIEGLRGGRFGGRPIDWFYYVNGVLADEGAAATRLHGGDKVWWDRHDWGAGNGPDAVVGSFPAPFAHGRGGRRPPVQIACTQVRDAACAAVRTALARVGARASISALATPTPAHALRILVGPYAALRGDATARRLEQGLRVSGVYARPSADGQTIAVLDVRGRVAQTLRAGSGLVVAMRPDGGRPVWIVTGTDPAGVGAAATALTPETLQRRFAIAASGGRELGVPAERHEAP